MRVQVKSIICCTDFSDDSNHGITYGIALAREFRAKLYVCHVIDLSAATMYGEGVSGPLEQPNRMINYSIEYLERLIGEQTQPIDWEPIIQIGHTGDEIARMAEEKKADLAVLATHGRSGLKRLILGSVTEYLMRALPCPLLTVRRPEHDFISPGKQEIRLNKILIGCDFSPDSSLGFQYGLSLAQEFQSELHLVHVIQPSVYHGLLKPGIAFGEERQQDLRDQLYDKLVNMVPEEARNWCRPSTTLVAGLPYEELTNYAVVHNVDLIILGVRGHSLVEMLFVGSTTDRVVRQAPCPVLTVRPMYQDKSKISKRSGEYV